MNREIELYTRELLSQLNLGDLKSTESISGGSINQAFRVETSTETYFLKVNSAVRFPNTFEAEKLGLELLSKSTFVVPKPIATTTIENEQFLLTEWIQQGSVQVGFWKVFGRNLAQLHSATEPTFGLDHNNYIGSLSQQNDQRKSWAEFYRDLRLVPQIQLAERNGQLTSTMKRGFDKLFQRLDELFPIEKSSLLHGDLWNGNLMVTKDGSACIFDPAVYYGHREMDLAMMALFGGFGNDWVNAYNEIYPLENGWRERIPIGQLYPLMVHVNLFGGSYINDVEDILKRL